MCLFQRARVPALLSVGTVWIFIVISTLVSSSLGIELKAADYLVHSIPGAPAGPLLKMHAGHIVVHPEVNGSLFFWLFHNQHIVEKQRCSSMDGAFMEIGPYRVIDDRKPELVYHRGSWDEFANVIFVDNPVGTGFSSVDSRRYVQTLPEMATQFVIFLENFFAMFPEYESDDLYIAGESYAGQYIPYITKAILERNKNTSVLQSWNIRSMLIGNGWIDPETQYRSYLPYAYSRNLVKKDSPMAKRLEGHQDYCVNELTQQRTKSKIHVGSCEYILQEILRETQNKGESKKACVNMYDIRLRDSYPSCGIDWPPDLNKVTSYLRRQDVVTSLNINAKHTSWRECDGNVGLALRTKASNPSVQIIPDILKEVPLVLFSGSEDLICNHLGTEGLIAKMRWNGNMGFGDAPRRSWEFEGEKAGFWQEARNLTYVLFDNASHMVAVDYSRRTRDMLYRVMGVDIGSIGLPFQSHIIGDDFLGPHTEAEAKLDAAKQHAYYRSGEIVLGIVAFPTVAWGLCIWLSRRRIASYKKVLDVD